MPLLIQGRHARANARGKSLFEIVRNYRQLKGPLEAFKEAVEYISCNLRSKTDAMRMNCRKVCSRPGWPASRRSQGAAVVGDRSSAAGISACPGRDQLHGALTCGSAACARPGRTLRTPLRPAGSARLAVRARCKLRQCLTGVAAPALAPALAVHALQSLQQQGSPCLRPHWMSR